jgi:four helix bundle protein
MLKSYKELIVWQKSIKLVKEIFVLTATFPKSELYGLVSQIRRAAISIPSNIAEGNGRGSRKEYSHSLSIAYGSALELETQLIIAKELNFVEEKDFLQIEQLLNEILRMLNTMRGKMRSLALVN